MSGPGAPRSLLRILVVDDEAIVRDSLAGWFRQDGHQVDAAASGKEALALAAKAAYDIALVDIKMPGMDGLELQGRLLGACPDLTVVIMTAYASVDTAVKALKEGAYDYVVKPFDPDDLSQLIRRAAEHRSLRAENLRLRQSLEDVTAPPPLIGRSPSIRRLTELIGTVAPTESTVLITGESGTGKELVARAIHTGSPRRFGPLVVVNCGALPEGVLESELFGHEAGARRPAPAWLRAPSPRWRRSTSATSSPRRPGTSAARPTSWASTGPPSTARSAATASSARAMAPREAHVPIHLVPVGDLPNEQTAELLVRLSRHIRTPWRLDAPLPAHDLAAIPGRGQWDADRFLARVEDERAPPRGLAVGVTTLDLAIPIFTFVFGRAHQGGRACVVSLARLDAAFYGLPPDRSRTLDRAVLEVTHELGHVFGASHCPDFACVMRFAASVEALDVRGTGFCASCAPGLPAWLASGP